MSPDDLTAAAPRRPLRVLHLIRTLGRGGAERNLVNVLRALPRGEHAVCYLRPPDDYADELRREGIPVRCLGLSRLSNIGGVISSLCNELWRGDYQLLYTQIWLADFIGRIAGLLARVPVISAVQTSAYEPEALAVYSRRGRLKTRMLQVLDGVTARLLSQRVIAVSQFVSCQTSRRLHMPKDRIAVVPNSVDLVQFQPASPQERQEIREGLALHPQDLVMLSVGKLNKGKGNDLLIQAMPAVLAQQPRARLLILGQGPEVPSLQRQAERLHIESAVRFLGQRPDVRRYLVAADLFVFASHYEGLPLAVLEAMACGLPCLLSNIPPHREIADEGRVAVLVAQQPEAWARSMIKLLGNEALRRELAELGRERCAQTYNAQVVARSLDALFQREALGTGPRPFNNPKAAMTPATTPVTTTPEAAPETPWTPCSSPTTA